MNHKEHEKKEKIILSFVFFVLLVVKSLARPKCVKFCLILQFGLVTGCAQVTREYSAPVTVLRNPRQLIKKVMARREKIKTISAMVNFTIQTGDNSKRFKQLIIIGEKGEIRLEALNFFGQPFFFIVGDPERITLYNSTENKFFTGEDGSNILAKITGINLSMKEIRNIISQDFFSDDYKIAGFENNIDKKTYFLSIVTTKAVGKNIIFDEKYYPLSVFSYNSTGELAYKINYSDYRSLGGRLFPYKIMIEFITNKLLARLHFKEITINKLVKRDVFTLPIPSIAAPYHF